MIDWFWSNMEKGFLLWHPEETTAGVKLIFRENSEKFILKKLKFIQKIQKNIR